MDKMKLVEADHELPVNAKTWIKLSPGMLAALTELAQVEQTDLQGLITGLINEALTQRLVRQGRN
jgi:hypothetical protein